MGDLETAQRCRAIKRDGERCSYLAKTGHGGFCGHHFPRVVPDQKTDIASSIVKWLAIANGLATLAKFVAYVFKGVLFAQTPPFLQDADSLISRASVLEHRAIGEIEIEQLSREVLELEAEFSAWFSRLPLDVQLCIYEWLDYQDHISEADKRALQNRIRLALIGRP